MMTVSEVFVCLATAAVCGGLDIATIFSLPHGFAPRSDVVEAVAIALDRGSPRRLSVVDLHPRKRSPERVAVMKLVALLHGELA